MTAIEIRQAAQSSATGTSEGLMQLLYVTEDVPNRDAVYGDGSSMIPFEVIRHMPANVAVTLVTFEGEVALPEEIQDRCERVVRLMRRPLRQATAVSCLTSLSVGAARLATHEAQTVVRQMSTGADVTLIHGPHASVLAGNVVGALVMQVVDPWSFRVDMERALVSGVRAAYRRRKARQARAREHRLPERARLLTVSEADARRWRTTLNRDVRSVPNGTDQVTVAYRRPEEPTICFVGSLNYAPNVESARILVREVAPRLWQRHPSLRVVLAGRQPAPEVLDLTSSRVAVLANVPSVDEVFCSSSLAVFPDRHGLGIRNSVREALAAGTAVVATAAAAREQPAHPLLHVAADLEELVERVDQLLKDGATVPSGGEAAAPERTWLDVALEYVEECRAAIAALEVPARA